MSILNEYIAREFPLVAFIFIMSVLFVTIYLLSPDCIDWWGALLSGLIVTGFASAIFTACGVLKKNHYIKCTIDDSISFNEIYEEYEIIKQEGRVYTLKDKYYFQGAND